MDETGFGFTAPVVTITGGNPTSGFEATATASGGVDNVTLDRWRKRLHHPADRRILAPQPARRRTGHRVSDHGRERRGQQRHRSEPGSGYTSAPTVTIWDGTLNQAAAAPATAAATIGISQIDITSGGQGYDSAPVVTITDTVGTPDKGASATATVAVRGAVTGITVTNSGRRLSHARPEEVRRHAARSWPDWREQPRPVHPGRRPRYHHLSRLRLLRNRGGPVPHEVPLQTCRPPCCAATSSSRPALCPGTM